MLLNAKENDYCIKIDCEKGDFRNFKLGKILSENDSANVFQIQANSNFMHV